MWGLRVCMVACTYLVAVVAFGPPCEQPPCTSDRAFDDAEQFFVKGVLFNDKASNVNARYGSLVGVLFLYANDEETEQDFKASKSSPVHPVEVIGEEVLEWVRATPSSAASLTHRAFVAGKEGWDGSPLWVIRANYSGELIPGKLAIKHGAAYVPYGGKEVPVDDFEVLCAPQHSLHWMPAKFKPDLDGVIVAGNTDDGEPLYIARCSHMGSTTPGKFDPRKSHAHISFNEKEITCWKFELLSRAKTFAVSKSPYLDYH